MTENIYDPGFVKDLFDRMSSSYERMNYISSFGFSIRWRRQFLRQLDTGKNAVEIIDLLTGMGETWNAVTKMYPGATITALDFSKKMLKNAFKKNQEHFNATIKLLQQDVLQNQLPSDYYDIVICAFGLKTFNDEQLSVLANETKRILKPGGQFSFIEVSKPGNVILQKCYGFYLGLVIPVIGRLLVGNPETYKMLWRYTKKFENAKHAAAIFNKAGLVTNYTSFFYGCATGFHGNREL